MSFWARRRRVFAAAAFVLATTGMVAYLWTGGEDGSGTSREGKVSTNIRYTEKKRYSNDSSFPPSKQGSSATNFSLRLRPHPACAGEPRLPPRHRDRPPLLLRCRGNLCGGREGRGRRGVRRGRSGEAMENVRLAVPERHRKGSHI